MSINGANAEFIPAANFNGAASFAYTVTDNGTTNGADDFKSATGNVSFTITAVNDNPVAGADSILRFPGQPVGVSIATLLANDSDVDGDSLILVSAGGAANGTVTTVASSVFYTPNAGNVAGDSFIYSISDGHGGIATGTVTITINPDPDPGQGTTIEMLPDGSMKVTFSGVIGLGYRVQSSDDLSAGSWVDRSTRTADASGKFSFTEPTPLPPRRFYRSITP